MSVLINYERLGLSEDQKKQQNLKKASTLYDKLLVAASYGDLVLVRQFARAGVNINSNFKQRSTPLYYAACNGHLQVVQFLVEQGADVNQGARGHLDNSPLNIAVAHGHYDVSEYLIRMGADVNYTGLFALQNSLETALWHVKFCSVEKSERLITLLIDNGAKFSNQKITPYAKLDEVKADILAWTPPLSQKDSDEKVAMVERTLQPIIQKFEVLTQEIFPRKLSIFCQNLEESVSESSDEDSFVIVEEDASDDEYILVDSLGLESFRIR